MSKLEDAMIAKYGPPGDGLAYTQDLGVLQGFIDKHPDWFMKRMGGHSWEVRNGVKDRSYYGKTLCEAICNALLEM